MKWAKSSTACFALKCLNDSDAGSSLVMSYGQADALWQPSSWEKRVSSSLYCRQTHYSWPTIVSVLDREHQGTILLQKFHRVVAVHGADYSGAVHRRAFATHAQKHGRIASRLPERVVDPVGLLPGVTVALHIHKKVSHEHEFRQKLLVSVSLHILRRSGPGVASHTSWADTAPRRF